MSQLLRRFLLGTALALAPCVLCVAPSHADTIVWRSPTKPLTIGLSTTDYTQLMFPEPIAHVVVEDPSYIDGKPLDGYGGRAIMFQSLLPKMATRAFFTGQSGNTYIVILTTDVPYRTYIEIVDGVAMKQMKESISSKMGPLDLVRAMAQDADVPGVTRETYVIPNWFRGSGMSFDLSEVWQSPTMTGLVVHVRNENATPNEVNLPAIVIPKTTEWGNLRFASMENLRLAPAGQPNDKGVLFLIFLR